MASKLSGECLWQRVNSVAKDSEHLGAVTCTIENLGPARRVHLEVDRGNRRITDVTSIEFGSLFDEQRLSPIAFEKFHLK